MSKAVRGRSITFSVPPAVVELFDEAIKSEDHADDAMMTKRWEEHIMWMAIRQAQAYTGRRR